MKKWSRQQKYDRGLKIRQSILPNLLIKDMKMVKLLVCGGRDFGNPNKGSEGRIQYSYIQYELNRFAIANSTLYHPTENWLPTDIYIISGGATGVDAAAIDWAVINWCPFIEYHANWKRYGKTAGPIRNQEMLDSEITKTDILKVMAFPGGNGTRDMIRRARKANLEVIVHTFADYESYLERDMK
jgi:hypothetical protein